MNISVVKHPLAKHYLSILRDAGTRPETFRATTRRLAYFLLTEATADIPLAETVVTTPLAQTPGYRLDRQMVAVPVLRAGLGLLSAVTDLLPDVTVGYAGVQRDEETALPQEYYYKIPDLSDSWVLVLEPMLATGGSLSWAIDKVKGSGAKDITALCVVAAPEGVKRINDDHPNVRIVTAALDEGLSSNYYIVPGLGDMGDRLFGTF
ncbi:MAG: uracil phosphoribosyltransferase [Acidimicrobiia bacterium]